jgi:hypothetical protein
LGPQGAKAARMSAGLSYCAASFSVRHTVLSAKFA